MLQSEQDAFLLAILIPFRASLHFLLHYHNKERPKTHPSRQKRTNLAQHLGWYPAHDVKQKNEISNGCLQLAIVE